MKILLEILKVAISFASALANYLHDKKMLEAGGALAIVEGLRKADETVKRVRLAGDAAVADFDEHNGVPDDDPNLRD